jgi:hypothetical protein
MLTQLHLKKIISYDKATGDFTWLISRGGKAKNGVKAGYLKPSGYIVIMIDNKNYPAHRLAFLYETGSLPENEVDHINRIKSDNRWENLRECTRFQNMMNLEKHPKNTSGYKGVSFMARDSVWVAQCTINKQHHFIGRFLTAELASTAYENFTKNNHKAFYYKNCE